MNRRFDATIGIAGVLAFGALGMLVGCGGAIVHTRGDAVSLIPEITAVVSLHPRLSFGKAGDQRRVARRTGDSLIEATGGHAILADELPSTDPLLIAESLRTFGEDSAHTLTFAVIAARADRIEGIGVATSGAGRRPTHRFADYTVRLDVRLADRPDILGSIETFATAFANAPEIDSKGRPVGLQLAIDQAISTALKRFAPNLKPGAPFPSVVELPVRSESSSVSGALAAVDKLRKLQVLYPELSSEDLAALASSRAQFLVVKPGRLAALGIGPGDLIGPVGGQKLGGRAALARTLARGDTPAMSIDRGGEHFVIGQALVAQVR